MTARFAWCCPQCRAPLEATSDGGLRCVAENQTFPTEDGIRCLLGEESRRRVAAFVADYVRVRRGEARGSDDPDYFRALPFRDLSGRHPYEWTIRARSFRALEEMVVEPLASGSDGPLRVADLGAGNGWLSNRMSLAGHEVAAVDLNDDPTDGLGACCHYESDFEAVQADFDALPFADGSLDLVVFNGSLHYSTDYRPTLREAVRTLRSGGAVAVLDTPVYRDPGSGAAMVDELRSGFRERFGVQGDALPTRGYLTRDDLARLAGELGLEWRESWPFYGLRWSVRPWLALLRGRREPASFGVIWAFQRGGFR